MDLTKLASLFETDTEFKKGIVFLDIMPALYCPDAFNFLIDSLCEPYYNLDLRGGKLIFAGIESRGTMLAPAMAARMRTGFVAIRKAKKLPRKVYQASYSLEYGQDTIEVQQDAFKEGNRIILVDDVIATGGTLKAAESLVQQAGFTVEGVAAIMRINEVYDAFPQNHLSAPTHVLFNY